MAEKDGSLPPPRFETAPRVLIVAAPFYRDIADKLIAGACAVLDACGATRDMIEVPGALDIPAAIRLAERRYEAFVALGCVLRGETSHYEIVSQESAHGLIKLGVERGLAIGNGILTCEDRAQAEKRADPNQSDKGGGAAFAALHLCAHARRFAEGPLSRGDTLYASGGAAV